MKTPADNPEGYAHFSLIPRAKDLHGRLMLVFGSGDDNVHPQNEWSFIDELVAADKPFDLMVYPMRKHPIDGPARAHPPLREDAGVLEAVPLGSYANPFDQVQVRQRADVGVHVGLSVERRSAGPRLETPAGSAGMIVRHGSRRPVASSEPLDLERRSRRCAGRRRTVRPRCAGSIPSPRVEARDRGGFASRDRVEIRPPIRSPDDRPLPVGRRKTEAPSTPRASERGVCPRQSPARRRASRAPARFP